METGAEVRGEEKAGELAMSVASIKTGHRQDRLQRRVRSASSRGAIGRRHRPIDGL